ncbi:MAG: hypothetical protein LUC85_03245 [Bacteroidales bacterium]|nr:hypothetical protein [Bacteroidales bacterium]
MNTALIITQYLYPVLGVAVPFWVRMAFKRWLSVNDKGFAVFLAWNRGWLRLFTFVAFLMVIAPMFLACRSTEYAVGIILCGIPAVLFCRQGSFENMLYWLASLAGRRRQLFLFSFVAIPTIFFPTLFPLLSMTAVLIAWGNVYPPKPVVDNTQSPAFNTRMAATTCGHGEVAAQTKIKTTIEIYDKEFPNRNQTPGDDETASRLPPTQPPEVPLTMGRFP